MFGIKLIALAAAIHGPGSIALVVSAVGCHPAWVGGASYSEGDLVSRIKATKTVTTKILPCTSGTDCVDGKRMSKETKTVSRTSNYECIEPGWCGSSAYDPAGPFGSMAWEEKGGKCSVSFCR